MRFTVIIFLICVSIISCNSQTQNMVMSIEEQTETLKRYYEKGSDNTGEEKVKYEQLFFKEFPSSFREMQDFFGYDDIKGKAPLYDYPIGDNIIVFFSKLKHIEMDDYYNKYIDICIDGKWEADNISEGFGLTTKLYYDTEAIISVLSEKTDKEIKSVFRFVFDGPHPDQRKESYEELHNKVKPVNPRVADLMKQAYEQLLSEDDGHGH